MNNNCSVMTMNTAGGCWWVEGVHDYYVDGALKELKVDNYAMTLSLGRLQRNSVLVINKTTFPIFHL